MWCKNCKKETFYSICDICGNVTEDDIPTEVFWCTECKVPIIKYSNAIDKDICPLCGKKTSYLCADLRPVFPEERLLLEALISKPLAYIDKTVWAQGSRYYIDGKTKMLYKKILSNANADEIINIINNYKEKNLYNTFNKQIERFVKANEDRLNYLKDEAYCFIKEHAKKLPQECIVISFSGGKDSTVVADLVIRALANPSLVHVFGDTTLELPFTIDYSSRYRRSNPNAIFKVARNKDQDFYSVCEDIGPPARMLRWCCSMFKTGPITRILNNLYRDKEILTFYGIRKSESVSRSKYNRVENNAEFVKIQKQTVASPIFFWKDIDVWLYIFSEKIDFNDAYRLGYDRVGCWCCPNNSERAQFLSRIYLPEQSKKWRDFLIHFANKIGKPDPEVYVDTGKWKARQGGQGIDSSDDVKVHFSNCTTEDHAKIYKLNKPITDNFYNLFIPFGIISKEMGRKIINEVMILDIKSKVPIISIQPFRQEDYEYAVKIKTLNVKNHDKLQRMISYQIKKYNACRKCLKCESLCKFGAITIRNVYMIDGSKCRRCKMCVTSKYIEGGCLMDKYLRTKVSEENEI